jgi:hypothetical protein
VSEPAVQFLEWMGFGQNNSSMRLASPGPVCSESLKVLTIECNHGALDSGGKGQVVCIGEAQVSGVPGSCAIHAFFGEHSCQYHRHVFVEVEPHGTVVFIQSVQEVDLGGRWSRFEGVVGRDVTLNLPAIVIIVGERIINGGQAHLRIVGEEFLG